MWKVKDLVNQLTKENKGDFTIKFCFTDGFGAEPYPGPNIRTFTGLHIGEIDTKNNIVRLERVNFDVTVENLLDVLQKINQDLVIQFAFVDQANQSKPKIRRFFVDEISDIGYSSKVIQLTGDEIN